MADNLEFYNQTFCTYCGSNFGNQKDHVIPHSYASLGSKSFKSSLVVPCCKECNTFLGDKILVTINERRLYIADTLKKKYKKLLKSPDWRPSEIKKLGPELAATIKEKQRLKVFIQGRINFAINNIIRNKECV